MTWFKPIKDSIIISAGTEESDLTSSYFINIPVRRKIYLDDLPNDIEQGEQVYVNLDDKFVNKYINSSLQEVTDNYSYLVVYEDTADTSLFLPIKSRAIDNVLYFNAVEKINKETSYTKYYSVYYGATNIKFLEERGIEGNTYYQKLAAEYIPSVEGLYFDLDPDNIQEYSYDATEDSQKEYKLAFYNNGLDWIDGKSQSIGAKAFGSFDGPKFRVIGKKGPNYGKFRIRIFSYYDNNSISKNVALDWTTVDCYASQESSDQILYLNTSLEYSKYIFEIEVISDKNVMSSSNSVEISKYQFFPNYKLTYDVEELNPNISFIKIGGIR
jgi:hypothetical protein